MREIKFRAWSSKFNLGIDPKHIKIRLDGKLELPPHHDERHVVIHQFTGLKDKNGMEIYEGDIVVEMGINYVVKWDNDSAMFITDSRGVIGNFIGLGKEDFEVIGNIYENLELLNGTS